MSSIRHFLILAVLCSSVVGHGQSDIESAYASYSQGDIEQASAAYLEVRNASWPDGNLAEHFTAYGMYLDCLHKTGSLRALQRELTEYDRRRSIAQASLTKKLKASTQHTSEMFHVLLADARGDLADAADRLKIITDSLLSIDEVMIDDNTRIRQFKILQQLADTYFRMGNFETAKGYANQALNTPIDFRMSIMYDGLALTPYLILSEIYTELNAYDAATTELETVLSLLEHVEERQLERYVSTLEKLISLNIQKGDIDAARKFLTEFTLFDSNQIFEFQRWRLTAEIAMASGNYSQAETALQRAAGFLVEDIEFASDDAGLIDLERGKVALALRDTSRADRFFRSGLGAFGWREEQLNAADLFDHLAVIDLLFYASLTREALGNRDDAWNVVSVAIEYVERLRATYNTADDRAELIAKSYMVFERALALCTNRPEKSWTANAFNLMERSKGLNLRDARSRASTLRSAGIPDSLVLFETEIVTAINDTKSDIRRMDRSGTPSELLRNLDVRRFSLELRLDSLRNALSAEYPAFQTARENEKIAGLDTVMNALSTDQMILEFFAGQTSVYAIGISNERTTFTKLAQTVRIDSLIAQYKVGIVRYLQGKSSADQDAHFVETLGKLYDLIMEPFEPLPRHLTIVPDGRLHELSFVSLIGPVNRPFGSIDFRNLPYIVTEHDLNYCYSVGLLNSVGKEIDDHVQSSWVFAPEIDQQSKFEPLPYALKEAEEVKRMTSAQGVIGSSCSASAVRNALRQNSAGSLLHLATHGSANYFSGSDSYLQFTGTGDTSKIFAYELYSMPLNYDLVYLSACETGGGSRKAGEGVYSLARAFFYAGANSLVTALWNIGDSRSSALTRGFYRRMMDGETVHSAIAGAQRSYLTSLEKADRYMAHPAFWSSLVVYGDSSDRLSTRSPNRILLSFAVLFGLFLFIFFWRKG